MRGGTGGLVGCIHGRLDKGGGQRGIGGGGGVRGEEGECHWWSSGIKGGGVC